MTNITLDMKKKLQDEDLDGSDTELSVVPQNEYKKNDLSKLDEQQMEDEDNLSSKQTIKTEETKVDQLVT